MSEEPASTAAEAKALWRRLAPIYRTWSMLWDSFVARESWGAVGVDLTTGVIESRKARKVAAVLRGASGPALDAVVTIAQVNAERATAIFRNVAIMYVTLPIAALALMSDAAPEIVQRFLTENADDVLFWVILLSTTPIMFFAFMWRAKQLAWSIELARSGAVEPLEPK